MPRTRTSARRVFCGQKKSEIFLPTSATGATQCHWYHQAPKHPQGEFSAGRKKFRNFSSNQFFHFFVSFSQKIIQKLFFPPVPLMPPSAKTSARKVFRKQKKNQKFFFQPVPLVPPSAKTSSRKTSRKKIQKLFFQPVPLVPPSAKTSARKVFRKQKKIKKLFFQPVPLVPPSAKTSARKVFR
jgi:hypothetical protein